MWRMMWKMDRKFFWLVLQYVEYVCLLPDVFLAAPHDEPLVVLSPPFSFPILHLDNTIPAHFVTVFSPQSLRP